MEATALKSLLAYLYTSMPGLATLSTDTLFHLLDTARMMCLTDLQDMVEEHISQTVLQPGTLVHVINLAVELKFPNITDICLRHVRGFLEKDPSLSSLTPLAMLLILEDQPMAAPVAEDTILTYIVNAPSLLSSWLQLYQWQGLEEQEEFLKNVQQLLVPAFLEKMELAGLLFLLMMDNSLKTRESGTERSGLDRRVGEAMVSREERRKELMARENETLRQTQESLEWQVRGSY